MTEPEKLPITSMDIAEQRRQELKALFPSVFAETKDEDGKLVESIDFEKLKAELGTFSDVFESRRERYNFDWPGKKESLSQIQKPSIGTLRPQRGESLNFNRTGNLFIEGDNLESLKLLQKSYYGDVDCIYIDPPYNTGNEFIYPDNFTESLETYLAYSKQVDVDGKKFSTNVQSDGRFHTKWLNMMAPRLYLARNLLAEHGVIFISIDDNEATNLKLLCNDIFGEENFVCQFTWSGGKKNDSRLVSVSHEYVLCYVRSADWHRENKTEWRQRKKGLDDIYRAYNRLKREHDDDYAAITLGLKAWFKSLPNSSDAKAHKYYSHVDERGIYFPDNISWPGGGGPSYEVLHPVTRKPVKVPSRGWMFASKEKMQSIVDDNRVHFGEDENSVPCIKSYLRDREMQVPYSVLYQDGRAATKRLRTLMGGDLFDHPKDEEVLAQLLEFSCPKDGVVLDFFAGSSATAHAVLRLNRIDGGNRKFIMVQLPEPCDPKSAAFQAGYQNIAKLSIERIKRSIEQVNSLSLSTEPLSDDGFRVFALAESHFLRWDSENTEVFVEGIVKQLELHIDHVDANADSESILFELLLKAGFDLNEATDKQTLAGQSVFAIAEGSLLICLEDEITRELIDAVAEAEPMQFICLDRAFKGNDQLKANAVQTFAARNQGREKAEQIIFRTV